MPMYNAYGDSPLDGISVRHTGYFVGDDVVCALHMLAFGNWRDFQPAFDNEGGPCPYCAHTKPLTIPQLRRLNKSGANFIVPSQLPKTWKLRAVENYLSHRTASGTMAWRSDWKTCESLRLMYEDLESSYGDDRDNRLFMLVEAPYWCEGKRGNYVERYVAQQSEHAFKSGTWTVLYTTTWKLRYEIMQEVSTWYPGNMSNAEWDEVVNEVIRYWLEP